MMHNSIANDAGRYLAHLIDCGLHGASALPLPDGVSWRAVYALARSNSVESMSWFGARTRDGIPDDIRAAWELDGSKTLVRRLRFDAEREVVFAEMEKAGLSYLPLRGALLASYYPQPEMRSMADNDFLYGFVEPAPDGEGFRIAGKTPDEQRINVRRGVDAMQEIMHALGYETGSAYSGNHESFYKAPSYNFEPHRRLVTPTSPHASYYDNPWKRAVRDESCPFSYRFSSEDEYIYLLAHAFKHLDGAGCGIRFVVDVRVFLDRNGSDLDEKYVRNELEKLELVDFERRVRNLANEAFGGACALEPLSEECRDLLAYLLGCGAYGTFERSVSHKLDKELVKSEGDLRAAKLGYLAGRLRDDEAVRAQFPRASRCAVLRPMLHTARWFRGFARDPGKIIAELRMVKDARNHEGRS